MAETHIIIELKSGELKLTVEEAGEVKEALQKLFSEPAIVTWPVYTPVPNPYPNPWYSGDPPVCGGPTC